MKKKKVDTVNLVIAAAISAALAITILDCLEPSASEAVSTPSLANNLIDQRQSRIGSLDPVVTESSEDSRTVNAADVDDTTISPKMF